MERILNALDRLGQRVRTLSAAPHKPEPQQGTLKDAPEPTPVRPEVTGLELQRAVEEIARKRDALDREARRSEAGSGKRRREDPFSDPLGGAIPETSAWREPSLGGLQAEIGELRRALESRLADDRGDQGREFRRLSDRVDTLVRNRVDERALAPLRGDIQTLRETVTEGASNHRLRALEAAYDEIVVRLDHMRSAIDNPRMVSDLVQRLADIRRLLAQAPTEADLTALAERIDTIADRLDDARDLDRAETADLHRQIASLAKAIANSDPSVQLQTIERRLGEVASQVVEVERQFAGFDVSRWQQSVDEQSALLSSLAQKTEQLPKVVSQVERQATAVESLLRSLGPLPDLASALPALNSELADLRSAVENGTGPNPELGGVIARIDALTQRLEEGPVGGGDAGLERRLDDIVAQLDRMTTPLDPQAIEALEQRFVALADRMEKRIGAMAGADGLPLDLVDSLQRIEALLAAPPGSERFAEIEARMSDMAEAVRSLERLAAPDLTAVEASLVALRADITTLDGDAVKSLEAEIRALADRVESLSRRESDDRSLAQLEFRIADLASRLETAPDGTNDVLQAIARMERALEAMAAQDLAGSGRLAAALDTTPLEASVAEIRGELASLQSSMHSGAHRDRDLLVAIGEAVERLAMKDDVPAARPSVREARPTGQNRDAGHSSSVATVVDREASGEIGSSLGETGSLRAEPAATAAATGPSDKEDDDDEKDGGLLPRIFGRRDKSRRERVEPAVETEADEAALDLTDPDLPLEPGSGKPAPRVAVDPTRVLPKSATPDGTAAGPAPGRPAADRAGHGAETPEPSRSEPTKADFIAAARRAAIAAGAEPADPRASRRRGPPAGSIEPSHRSPAISTRIGSALATHRRKILQAVAAAVILAVGIPTILPMLLPTKTAAPAIQETGTAPAMDEPAAEDAPGAAVEAIPAPAPVAVGETALAPQPVAPGSFGPATEAPPPGRFEPTGIDPAGTAAPTPSPQMPLPPIASGPAPTLPEAIGPLALRQAAADGDPLAQLEVAARYSEGRGVPQDLEAAVAWYSRAAEGGQPIAQYRLGSLFEKGHGTARDPAAAISWYRRAADAGNITAMHNLAVMAASGTTGQPDYATAARWFEGAAEHGVRDSQFNLAVLYANGSGVPRDLAASYKWFALAAQAGDADAAKMRDNVAQELDKDLLARARLAVETWTAEVPDPAANDLVIDNPAWLDAAEETASLARDITVADVQRLLSARGYDPGPADGQMGKRTRDAIAAFQAAASMPVTGQIDAALVQALASREI